MSTYSYDYPLDDNKSLEKVLDSLWIVFYDNASISITWEDFVDNSLKKMESYDTEGKDNFSKVTTIPFDEAIQLLRQHIVYSKIKGEDE